MFECIEAGRVAFSLGLDGGLQPLPHIDQPDLSVSAQQRGHFVGEAPRVLVAIAEVVVGRRCPAVGMAVGKVGMSQSVVIKCTDGGNGSGQASGDGVDACRVAVTGGATRSGRLSRRGRRGGWIRVASGGHGAYIYRLGAKGIQNALIPPPQANQVHYHGVLASRSRLRVRVRPKAPKVRPRPASVGKRLSMRARGPSRWRSWSALRWRVCWVNGFACPKRGEGMALRAVVLPPSTLRVLGSLGWSARGPP